jgi:PqqD family protein of HPr-rel-A system
MSESVLTADWRPRVNSRVLCRIVEDEAVLLDLDSGEYHGLNPVGTRIWQLLSDGRSVGAICEALCREYDVPPETVREDVELLLTDLLNKRLIAE